MMTHYHYLQWSCAACRGAVHRVTLHEPKAGGGVLQVEQETISEITAMDFTLPVGGEIEVTYRLMGELDLTCPERGLPGPLGGYVSRDVRESQIHQRILAAVNYTVLDPDERKALIHAIARELE